MLIVKLKHNISEHAKENRNGMPCACWHSLGLLVLLPRQQAGAAKLSQGTSLNANTVTIIGSGEEELSSRSFC